MAKAQEGAVRKFALFRNPRTSIISRLIYSCLGFGLVLGAVFPFYSSLFVDWKPGMLPWFVIGCLGAGLIMGFGVFFMFSLLVLKPLREIRNIAVAVAAKDLTASCNIKSDDVIGDISVSINRLLEMLESIIEGLSTRTSSVAQASFSVSSLITDVMDNAISQQKESKNSSQLIGDMLVGARDINSNAITAAAGATETEENAAIGGKELEKVNKSISDLAGELNTTSNTMTALQERSDSVGEVVKVISEIADQTNLLALNAAIEAARAGEQGRGFAVVADEVRTLASRTHDSTVEIQTMIEDLQRETRTAVTGMQSAKDTAQHNAETISSVASKLLEIIGSMGNIATMNRKMEASSNEQTSSSDEVNHSIGNILSMSDVVVNDATKSLNEMEQLIELTGDLQEMISSFKIQSDTLKNQA